MTVFGWDASDFDWARGPMDLAAARADGIDFFTHKATEGTGVKHVRYREALERARAAGIPFLGAYIVIRSGSVSAQVDYFLSYLDSATPWWRATPQFFIQVDLEKWPYDAVAPSQGVAAAELLRQRSGKWVVLYAPQWAYGNTISGADPLWASAYGGNPALPYRQAYPGDGDGKRWQGYSGRTPTFLQYGSTTIIGSQHTCDANAFRGSLADLSRLITGSANLAKPDQPKEDDDMGVKGIIIQDKTGIVLLYPHPVTGEMVTANVGHAATVDAWTKAGWVGSVEVDDIGACGRSASAVAKELLAALAAGGHAGGGGPLSIALSGTGTPA